MVRTQGFGTKHIEHRTESDGSKEQNKTTPIQLQFDVNDDDDDNDDADDEERFF